MLASDPCTGASDCAAPGRAGRGLARSATSALDRFRGATEAGFAPAARSLHKAMDVDVRFEEPRT